MDLQYFDRNDNKHDVGNIKVYTYGKYTDLPGKVNLNSNPQEVSWYTNANMIGTATTSTTTVSKTTYHVLYGKEDKLKVSFGATCNNLTYNSVNQQLTTIPKDEQGKYRILVYYGGQIISNEAKDAKTYTVVAMLNPGYTWADGSTKAKAKQCTIKPYPVEFNPNTNPCNSNLIYNGSIQYLVTTKSCGAMATPAGTISTTYGKLGCIGENWGTQEYGATYGSVYGKDAGNYPVTYHLTSSNYVWADGSSGDKTYTCKIKPYRVEFNPNTNPCKPNLVYNGNAQELTTTSSCGGVSNSIAVGGGAGTGSIGCISGSIYGSEAGATFNPMRGNNAGSYPVTYHLKNSNFVWADGSSGDKTYTCKISPKKVSYPSDPCKKNLIYNSEKQYLLTIGDSGGPGAVLIMGTIWHNESSGYSDGYVQVGSKGYDYYIDGEYTGTNAQEYPVQFVLNNDENVNYTWSDGSTANKIYICKIDRYKIDTPTTGKCNKNLVYNGKDQLLTTDATSTTTTISILDDKGAYTISNRTRKDAGSQTVSYDIYNSQNYEWEDGSQSTKDISCSIAPKEISVTWGSTSTHAYDGKEWGRSASASTGISGETMTLTVTKKKKVGTYNTTATCSKVTNSKCSNYSLTNTTSTFSITDTTAPTCSVSVSSGTISMSGSDNYGLAYISAQGKGITTGSTYKSTGSACDSGTASSSLSFSSTITNMDRSSVTITGTVRDCAGNQNTCTTTVTRVIQKRTATCSSGKGCKEAGCQTRNYCRDKSCGCDTFNDWGSYSACNIPSYAAVSNDYTQCSKCNNGFYQCHTRTCNTYKSCQNSNCSCATYYTDIGKCGCASWGDYSGWQTVDSCSSGESGDHSTYTDCQTIFK